METRNLSDEQIVGLVESGNTDIGLPQEFFINLSDRCANRGDELERIGSPSHSASLAILMEFAAIQLSLCPGSTTSHISIASRTLSLACSAVKLLQLAEQASC